MIQSVGKLSFGPAENSWFVTKMFTQNYQAKIMLFVQLKEGLKKSFRILVMFPAMVPDNNRYFVCRSDCCCINPAEIHSRVQDYRLVADTVFQVSKIHVCRLFQIVADTIEKGIQIIAAVKCQFICAEGRGKIYGAELEYSWILNLSGITELVFMKIYSQG